MPKLERLEWIEPLASGHGVTLTDIPEANLFLAEDPNALLLGVVYDSQYQTRRAFAIPFVLRSRLGHFDINRLASEVEAVHAAFTTKPALHRFPNRYAEITGKVAAVIVERYTGDASQIWKQSSSPEALAEALMALPSFGPQKTDWTVGMLGQMGVLTFDGWDGYRVARK